MTVEPLTPEQIQFVIRCLGTWVQQWMQKYSQPPRPPDVDHSALLRRLLAGKPLLRQPPPLRNSSPCYELAEGEEIEIYELYDLSEQAAELRGGTVSVDQGSGWEWVERDKVLRFRPTGDLYDLRKETRHHKMYRADRVVEEVPYTALLLKKRPLGEGGLSL